MLVGVDQFGDEGERLREGDDENGNGWWIGKESRLEECGIMLVKYGGNGCTECGEADVHTDVADRSLVSGFRAWKGRISGE